MSKRACIVNADVPLSRLRYHRVGSGWVRGQWTGFSTLCSGTKVDDIFGIASIRVERAEAMGAKPCRKCFKEER